MNQCSRTAPGKIAPSAPRRHNWPGCAAVPVRHVADSGGLQTRPTLSPSWSARRPAQHQLVERGTAVERATPGPRLFGRAPCQTADGQPHPDTTARRYNPSKRENRPGKEAWPMPIDPKTGLDPAWGITDELMRCPMPRVPLVAPGTEPEELKALYAEKLRQWGTVARYAQLLAHVPAALEGWTTMDRGVRLKYQSADPEFLRIEELVVIKTSIMNRCNN
ncbi:MAG: hypothetical protein IT307_11015 [Chloroflexi bacterium]|nr:hypothetical protein [Chloroflexota bacterium]